MSSMESDVGATEETFHFDNFVLSSARRLLTRDGQVLSLGDRALDLLIALISRAGQIVTKRELQERMWPNAMAEETSLRFHMAKLRQALDDGRNGHRYITTQVGRGYCFVAPVELIVTKPSGYSAPTASAAITGVPHPPLRHLIGREMETAEILQRLSDTRFTTIVGPGGVGKTTLALAVAHELSRSFAGATYFADLGALSDCTLVPAALASLFGISLQSEDPFPGLLAFLAERRALLIFDNCEHVIETLAPLAERIFATCAEATILATSREALRVTGEHIYRLGPLRYATRDEHPSTEAAFDFPAAQLFIARANAGGAQIERNAGNARLLTELCERLDGMALALELAAANVASHGLGEVSALLNERLPLTGVGRRTSPPRHHSLQAMMDWSYQLLSACEQNVLDRLGVFVGTFSADAAREVLRGAGIPDVQALTAIQSLIAKSLIAVDHQGPRSHYRLLETTRDYVAERLSMRGIRDEVGRAHALFVRDWLEEIDNQPDLAPAELRSQLGNVRAALEWAFGAEGERGFATALAAR